MKIKQLVTGLITRKSAKRLLLMGLAVTMLVAPAPVYADNTARQNNNFSNPNWQNTHHYDNWNWQHNRTYQAPQYQFETTFPVDQWGRPTTSNVAPQHTRNIRRDRHSAVLPPSHGTITGFFSGEFTTEYVNPFAPSYNNNPNASHAVAVEESVFALIPGEAGVNVRADGSHAGGFLASTSVNQGGGGGSNNSVNNAPHGGPTSSITSESNAPWTNPGTQISHTEQPHSGGQSGVTVTHSPMPGTNAGTAQTGNQSGRITAVTPFEDGTIGRITIPALNNRVASVRPGVAMSTLDNYIGHFPNTSQWDGNVALASHNRGRGSFFAGIWTLQYGDRIIYETTMGARTFEVVSVEQISERDLNNLNHSHENFLNLVTCVYGQSSLRWNIKARQVN